MIEKPTFKKGRIMSFKYAFDGIAAAIKQEPSIKIHLLFAFLVPVAAIYLKVSRMESIILVLLIGLVLALELTNTAIEAVVNHFTDLYHPGAKLAKDISAGAVLVLTITAIIIGLSIFLPYISELL